MAGTNHILDYVTEAAKRAARAEAYLDAIAVYVSSEQYPEKNTILALATMGECMPEEEEQEDENDGK